MSVAINKIKRGKNTIDFSATYHSYINVTNDSVMFGHKGANGINYELAANIDDVKKAINSQSPWIPCSERLPEEEYPFGSCNACGYEFNSELINEYNIKFCPNCGTRIKPYEGE